MNALAGTTRLHRVACQPVCHSRTGRVQHREAGCTLQLRHSQAEAAQSVLSLPIAITSTGWKARHRSSCHLLELKALARARASLEPRTSLPLLEEGRAGDVLKCRFEERIKGTWEHPPGRRPDPGRGPKVPFRRAAAVFAAFLQLAGFATVSRRRQAFVKPVIVR